MQLFQFPLNYGLLRTGAVQTTDNNYNTFYNQAAITYNIDTVGDATGSERKFTHIFIKCSGVTDYTIFYFDPVEGDQTFNRVIPNNVINDSNISVPITIDGISNDLWRIPEAPSGTIPSARTITFNLNGPNPKVYQVLIINQILEFNNFRDIEYDSIDLGSLQSNVAGGLSYSHAINAERDKWLVRVRPQFIWDRDHEADNLVRFIRTNKTFVCAVEYNRYPDMVFIGLWPDTATQIRLIGRSKRVGRRVRLTVREA